METITNQDPLLLEVGQVINTLNLFEPELSSSVASNVGIQEWFKAYISSEDFNSLHPKDKKEAFEIYEGLKHVMEQLLKHNLSEMDCFLGAQSLSAKYKI